MPELDAVKDSGAREEFDTGSKRDTRKGRGRYGLITPIALKRLAQHYENGAAKYGDRNWEKGQPVSRYLGSANGSLFRDQQKVPESIHVMSLPNHTPATRAQLRFSRFLLDRRTTSLSCSTFLASDQRDRKSGSRTIWATVINTRRW